MKKVLSLALILALGIGGFAQTRRMAPSAKATMSPKVAVGNEKVTAVNPLQNVENPSKAMPSKGWHYENHDEYEVMVNSYDLQSNNGISNRIAAFGDGSLAVVATFMPGDKSPYNQASGYRGTGYNYFDGSDFGEQPEARIESSMTGWPSIAPLGPNGEIFVAHNSNGLVYYTRENKGEGSWNGPHEIPNPEGSASVTTTPYALTWPRVATCGPDHNIINVISSDQSDSGGDDAVYEYTVFLSRSTDGGETWTTTKMPALANDGVNQCTADDYSVAFHGNNIAVLISSPYNAGGGEYHTTDVVLLKSTDAGETWTNTLVWKNPIDGNWFDPFVFDTVNHKMAYFPTMGSVAMDNDGVAHVALTAEAVCAAEAGTTTYSYYYGTSVDGAFYWKEGDEPFTTGPVFEENGYTDSYKALCPWDTYDLGVDEDGDGENEFLTAYNERWIAGTPVYTVGQGDDALLYDYCSLLKLMDNVTDEEWAELAPTALQYFEDYKNHLYRNPNDGAINGNYTRCMGAGNLCGWPSITVDDNGMVAIAYSVPDFRRDYDANGFLYRCIYVTYIDHGVVYPNADYLAEDFSHMVEEMVNLHALPYSYGNRQFVFSYMGDINIGWAGTSPSSGDDDTNPPAHDPTENTHYVSIITPDARIDNVTEAVNPMNSVSVRPNPANETLYIDVNASQSSNMTATVYNITGQKVMEQNMAALTTGANTRSINVSNLTSGIYFVTVKANGFEETKKFVVK